MMIIKCFYQFIEGEDLAVILGAPAQKGHKIHHCFADKALLDKVLIGGVTASFRQLFMLLVGDEGTVDIDRHLPAESLIKPVILG